MKTISIKQPWASLIVSGVKDIENRTWKTNFRGRVLVHATAKRVKFDNWYDSPLTNEQILKLPANKLYINLEYSAIIGSVEIVDCVINHPSIWAEKSIPGQKRIHNWMLANPVLFAEPILNVKGKLSFWDYPMTEEQYLNLSKVGNPLSK